MKKLIPLLIMAGAMASYAQTVNFNNNILTSPPDRLVYAPGGARLVGQNYTAVLLYGTSDASLTAHTQTALFRVATTASPGTWSGGTRTLTGVPSTPGTVLRLQVAVFDNTQFANYAAALAGNGILGRNLTPFDYTVPSQPPAPGADSMVNFTSFTLVPEPSVIGLGLVGVAALVMLRRRK
jgi:hypothetical protein